MKKMKKQGGFTLVEMLIVVAIIAILVAISIPMVSADMDKAKDATDKANMRAAKAVATIECMSGNALGDDQIYNAEKGEFSSTAPTENYGQKAGKYIKVTTAGTSTKVAELGWVS